MTLHLTDVDALRRGIRSRTAPSASVLSAFQVPLVRMQPLGREFIQHVAQKFRDVILYDHLLLLEPLQQLLARCRRPPRAACSLHRRIPAGACGPRSSAPPPLLAPSMRRVIMLRSQSARLRPCPSSAAAFRPIRFAKIRIRSSSSDRKKLDDPGSPWRPARPRTGCRCAATRAAPCRECAVPPAASTSSCSCPVFPRDSAYVRSQFSCARLKLLPLVIEAHHARAGRWIESRLPPR